MVILPQALITAWDSAISRRRGVPFFAQAVNRSENLHASTSLKRSLPPLRLDRHHGERSMSGQPDP